MKFGIMLLICMHLMTHPFKIDSLNQTVSYIDEIEGTSLEEEVEYTDAATIWAILHDDYGLNDYVCAGILGNIMVECGGSTLDLKVEAETKSYYGICQWSKKYYPDAKGLSLEEQCDYLMDTIEKEFKTFGKLYKKKFTYEDFLELEDEQSAALAFAKCYERCSSGGYKRRKNCATTAYEYFAESVTSNQT